MNQKIIVILGATSTGKSELGVELAKNLPGRQQAEIISADSRQVYKGLDLASGKVKGEWMHARKHGIHSILTFVYKNVPHHCIDFARPRFRYTVAQYQDHATRALKGIQSRKKIPIIVGGTGFYIDALTEGISFPEVSPNEELRAELEELAPSTLMKRLKELDPYRAERIDPSNTRRVIRAIEVADTLGTVPPIERSPLENVIKIGLRLPDIELHKRIKKRLHERIENGMVDEISVLHSRHNVSWARFHELGLEVRYAACFLRKQITETEMREQLFVEIKKFAKRQMTYWKRDKNIQWIDAKAGVKGIEPLIPLLESGGIPLT